jgi:hypothetical protein
MANNGTPSPTPAAPRKLRLVEVIPHFVSDDDPEVVLGVADFSVFVELSLLDFPLPELLDDPELPLFA